MRKGLINKLIANYIPEERTGRKSKIPKWRIIVAIVYKIKTGIQWKFLPIKTLFKKCIYSWQSVYYYFNKWSKKGYFEKIFQELMKLHKADLDLNNINLDGTHTRAKKGGQKVSYQGRKKANTTNLLIITDSNGCPLACSPPISGKHNDAFELEKTAAKMFSQIRDLNISTKGLFLNADAGFDSQAFKDLCSEEEIIYNIAPNKRRKKTLANDTYIFDNQLYMNRFVVEQCNAWIDSYKTLVIRYATSATNWLQMHYLVFILIFLKKYHKLSVSF